ncbi:MAG: PH domain-containing protein [Candidatus Saccharimonadales bacterium]|jgi:hypothetical protein
MKKKAAKLTAGGKPKYFEDQFDDEEVLYVFRKHPIVMRKGLIWGSVGLLVGPLYTLAMTFLHPNNPPSLTFFYLSFVVSLAVSGLLFFPAWMSWFFSVFILTNQRFIQVTQQGFFHRSVSDVPLNLIQSINYEISGMEQTLLGFGTIVMQTFLGNTNLHHIHHPAKVQRRLVEHMREAGVTPANIPVKLEGLVGEK